ncbi:hypothetical protein LY78DRAFT_655627 [Colletotrichum sublineola]|uniref:DUF2423 domain-containing protein n=1 Tax=Colletotrichum sublineola TaxID=1173701 RepID=A0A066XGR8_COLSU|nr:hypothetical protein LY78DRAFT_655627 [Colletotrichum sublineola]KDN68393.1 hypothetical protein CSUB01_01598 [Colletotrichum sublineola]
MAKSSRSSVIKKNNQRLKANVFGPVEQARAERLSAKLQELARQPKPEKEADIDMDIEQQHIDAQLNGEDVEIKTDDNVMDVDSAKLKRRSGRIQKQRKKNSKVVFPKYKDRHSGVQKKKKA